ncbi:MAG TPA: FAD-dependent oxidoreductase [Actinomycetota bacterium]|nr:FAD-dependent oxidoreductase [Actinomycetota bacterium]
MAGRRQTFVIVGANLTGGAAVSTLRDQGFDGRIVLIGDEIHPPYERPPLSKGYLRGQESFEDTLLRPREWYEQNDVDLLLGKTASRIGPADRVVEVDDGDRISYDKVLVATGGRNRHLPVPGGDLEGVRYLRTVEDSDAIRSEAQPGRKAAVVGAGFIGCEVAASLRSLDVEVEVVEIFEFPLVRVVGPELGRVYESIHRDHGVRFHFDESVERFEGTGRVEAIVTSKKNRIGCDFAVVGVGIRPATEVVEGSGVEVGNGIIVDQFCRTNVDGVYAAGDVANHDHPLFRRQMRVEHWDNALKQGAAAARNMMGTEASFADPHWFWSDQYDVNLQYMGFATEWDELVVRGSLEDRNFVGFYVKDGIVDAVVGMNRGREVRRAAGVIQSRQPVDTPLLRDEDVELKKLSQSLSRGGV